MINTARAMREYAVTKCFVELPSISLKKISTRPQIEIHHTMTKVEISNILGVI